MPLPTRTLILLLAALLACSFAAWRILWVGPEKSCVAHHRMWDKARRVCVDAPVAVDLIPRR
jgi:hypothetical protein